MSARRAETFDRVILATPSYVAAELLAPVDPPLGEQLGRIEHSGTAIVSLGFDRGQIGHPMARRGRGRAGRRKEPHPGHQLQQPQIPASRARGQGDPPRVRRRRPSAGNGRDGRRAAAAAGARRSPPAVADHRASRFTRASPIGRERCRNTTWATSELVARDRSPGRRNCRGWSWPATPITAWAFPTASTAAS